jgi:hypothetical protein
MKPVFLYRQATKSTSIRNKKRIEMSVLLFFFCNLKELTVWPGATSRNVATRVANARAAALPSLVTNDANTCYSVLCACVSDNHQMTTIKN